MNSNIVLRFSGLGAVTKMLAYLGEDRHGRAELCHNSERSAYRKMGKESGEVGMWRE